MRIVGAMFMICLLMACSDKNQHEDGEKEQSPKNSEGKQTLITELQSPWDIEHHSSTFYVSERKGTITSWTEGGSQERFPVETEKAIVQVGEGGLLGFKLHPDFEDNHQAFVYHTYEQDQMIKNRLISIEKRENRWVEVKAILEGIPGAKFHNGGRVEIGPEDMLYVTTGDSLDSPLAQSKDSLAGKVLRMNMDGSIPEDNPFQDSYIYSLGHRNPQGLAWSEEGEMFASEHGPDNHDEINQIAAGNNYGWPLIKGEEGRQGLVNPVYQTGNETWAPSGIIVANSLLYIASLRGKAVRSLHISGENPKVILEGLGRVRDVEEIDGNGYLITNNTDGRGNPDAADDRLIRFTLP